MKKKFLVLLLFFSVLISGCSVGEMVSTEDVKTRTSAEKKDVPDTDAEQTSPSTQEPKKSEETATVTPTAATQPETDESDEAGNKTAESPASDGKKITSPEKTAEGNNEHDGDVNADKKSESNGGTPPKEPENQPDAQKSAEDLSNSLFGDNNLIMAGIIAVLVVILLILVWLIYERHKMKTALNNLNDRPPNPAAPPQNINTPPQNAAPIVTTPLTQPPANGQLTIRVDNFREVGARTEQQDSFCVSDISNIIEKGFMAVVADGMGGLEGGAAISQLVADTFNDSYKNQFNFEPTAFLYHTAESAEFAVEEYIKQTGINGGSTLVAVMIKNSQMNYVSVGDSHIYLLRDNTLTLINKEHSFGALLKEKADRGEIDPREPYVNPKRNSLTAYIGMGSFKIVDRNANPIILRGGDKVLLCSDGVYNALGDDALKAAMAGTASTAAAKIKADILAQNIPSQDNFTAVVIECVSM